MRVLALFPGHEVGGAEIAGAAVVSGLRSRGHNVEIGIGRPGRRISSLFAPDHHLAIDPTRKMLAPVGALQLMRLCRSFDVVYANHRWPALLALPSRSLTGVELVYHCQSKVSPRGAAMIADHVLAVSQEIADGLRTHGLPEDRLTVLHNVPQPRTPSRTEVLQAREQMSSELGTEVDMLVVTVARLVLGKGVGTLLDALQKIPTAGLTVIGDGPERSDLEARSSQLGISHRVAFAGWQVDPAALIAAADVLVMPSDTYPEGTPLVIGEALSLGVPVIATRVGGVPELLEGTNRAGTIVQPGNTCELAEAIKAMLDEEYAEKAKGAARRWATERRPASAWADDVTDVIEQVVARDRIGPEIDLDGS